MKRIINLSLAAAFLAVTPAAGRAQADHVKHTDTQAKEAAKPVQAPVHKGTGVVRKVDPAKGTITLAHERIPSLNWPPMVMPFNVKDKSLLDKAQAGKKVEFEFVQQGRENVITSVK